MSSRRYIKRLWRVPKDRGPVHYLATLICKALIKHGWPATWRPSSHSPFAFSVLYDDNFELPDDFRRAVEIAVRITARTYRVEVLESFAQVELQKTYRVTSAGQFQEIKE